MKTGRCDAAAFTEMGKRFVASRNIQEDWLRDCPQVIRSVAIRDLKAAFSSNLAISLSAPAFSEWKGFGRGGMILLPSKKLSDPSSR